MPSSSAWTTSASSSPSRRCAAACGTPSIYAVVTSGLKVVLGMLLAVLLTSSIRVRGAAALAGVLPRAGQHGRGRHHLQRAAGTRTPAWSTPSCPGSGSPARTGSATRRPRCSRSPSSTSGRASGWPRSSTSPASCPSRRTTTRPSTSTAAGPGSKFRNVTLPLSRPATFTVILLSFIGGLRSFDLIWTMTKGGPGVQQRRHRLGHLQAVPGRLLRPGHRGQRRAVHPRDRDRLPAVPVLQLQGGGAVRGSPAPRSSRSSPSSVAARRLRHPVRLHVPDRGQDARTRPRT